MLSLARLSDLSPVDSATGQMEAGAGLKLATLAAHARAAGFDAGLDFATRDNVLNPGVMLTGA